MTKYKLTRILKTDNSGELRGDSIEGEIAAPLCIGERFVITAGVRFVSTSPVANVDVVSQTFQTLSGSIYKLEKIDELAN